MKVFLDTNILLDFVEQRNNLGYAKTILELGKKGELELYASYLTFANMAYILRHRSKDEIYKLLKMARNHVKVLDNTPHQLDKALNQIVNDFEDLLQYYCALSGECDLIITNNKKDFEEFSKSTLILTVPLLLSVERI